MAAKEIFLPDVRLAFADIYQPGKPDAKGRQKYGASLIFPKESEAYKRAEKAFIETSQEEYGANWANFLGAMEASKKCLRDGNKNLNAQTGEIRKGFEGLWYVAAKNKAKPFVIAHRLHNNKQVHIAEDGTAWIDGRPVEPNALPFQVIKPYAGCYVNAKVAISAMKAKDEAPANVFARLIAIQYLRAGEAFSGGGNSDGFEDTGGDEGEGAAPAENLFG